MDLEKAADNFPVLSLGFFISVAGLSKFVVPEYWTGYEPQIVKQLVPLSAENLMLTGGVFELVLGLMLIARRKVEHVSAILVLWLAAITVQLTRLGLWDLAIRDLGLTLYALSVYLIEKC